MKSYEVFSCFLTFRHIISGYRKGSRKKTMKVLPHLLTSMCIDCSESGGPQTMRGRFCGDWGHLPSTSMSAAPHTWSLSHLALPPTNHMKLCLRPRKLELVSDSRSAPRSYPGLFPCRGLGWFWKEDGGSTPSSLALNASGSIIVLS